MSLKKRLLALGLGLVMTVSTLTACGGEGGANGTKTVKFMYGGDVTMAEMYKYLIEEFNNTIGKEQGITVKGIPKTSGVEAVMAQQLPSDSGPDVVETTDKNFKRFAQYFEDLTGEIDSAVQEDYYDDTIIRYHYDIETTTSNKSDPLYGIPLYNTPTVLFYNKTVLDKLGIICISVDEEDIDAFNAGTLADANGKKKSDYGITVDVPKKGFYRSVAPYVPSEGETDGSSWVKPIKGEVLIFNDRIPMNWDEIEDIGMICTKERNAASPSQYGYYTQFWFNYGWSVGGNCLEDLSGNGDWAYSLAGTNPNYIVEEGKTFTGAYTGTVYKEGETLDVKDVLNASVGDKIAYETDGKSYYNYTVNGNKATMRDFSAEVANGTLTELPSIKDAFSRFAYLAGVGGLNVCPYPNAFSSTSAAAYFATGSLAFLVEVSSCSVTIDKIMEEEWDIAPLPQYKIYTDPLDPACDTVVKEGKLAGHSMGYAICLSKKSKAKDEALVFLKWLATDGQKYLAENGYVSSRKSDADIMVKNLPYDNAKVVLDSFKSCSAGDWWFLLDNEWITTWSTPLNNEVRYGKMGLEEFLYKYIEPTNKKLAAYK